jgi:hypothetical protein
VSQWEEIQMHTTPSMGKVHAVVAAFAYSIAGWGNHMLTSRLNDFVWAGFVLTLFPRDTYHGRGV